MSSDATANIDELHRQLFEEGLKVRKEVLGNEYVEKALNNATPFTRPGQEFITEWAWGNVWQRPGLDRKQRSLLSKYNYVRDNSCSTWEYGLADSSLKCYSLGYDYCPESLAGASFAHSWCHQQWGD